MTNVPGTFASERAAGLFILGRGERQLLGGWLVTEKKEEEEKREGKKQPGLALGRL